MEGEFVTRVSVSNIRRHLSNLRTITKRKFPGVPEERVGFRIDYTTIPPTMAVFLVDSFIAEAQAKSSLSPLAAAQTVLQSGVG